MKRDPNRLNSARFYQPSRLSETRWSGNRPIRWPESTSASDGLPAAIPVETADVNWEFSGIRRNAIAQERRIRLNRCLRCTRCIRPWCLNERSISCSAAKSAILSFPRACAVINSWSRRGRRPTALEGQNQPSSIVGEEEPDRRSPPRTIRAARAAKSYRNSVCARNAQKSMLTKPRHEHGSCAKRFSATRLAKRDRSRQTRTGGRRRSSCAGHEEQGLFAEGFVLGP